MRILLAGALTALMTTGAYAQSMPNANQTPMSPHNGTMPSANRTSIPAANGAMPNANTTNEPGVAPSTAAPIAQPTACAPGQSTGCMPQQNCPNAPPGTPCPSPTGPAQH